MSGWGWAQAGGVTARWRRPAPHSLHPTPLSRGWHRDTQKQGGGTVPGRACTREPAESERRRCQAAARRRHPPVRHACLVGRVGHHAAHRRQGTRLGAGGTRADGNALAQGRGAAQRAHAGLHCCGDGSWGKVEANRTGFEAERAPPRPLTVIGICHPGALRALAALSSNQLLHKRTSVRAGDEGKYRERVLRGRKSTSVARSKLAVAVPQAASLSTPRRPLLRRPPTLPAAP